MTKPSPGAVAVHEKSGCRSLNHVLRFPASGQFLPQPAHGASARRFPFPRQWLAGLLRIRCPAFPLSPPQQGGVAELVFRIDRLHLISPWTYLTIQAAAIIRMIATQIHWMMSLKSILWRESGINATAGYMTLPLWFFFMRALSLPGVRSEGYSPNGRRRGHPERNSEQP